MTLVESRVELIWSVMKELPSGDRLLLEISINDTFEHHDFKVCKPTHIKSIPARHGTLEVVFRDNEPQFKRVAGSEFHRFTQEWGFEHRTSSRKCHRIDGFAEVAVGTIKRSLRKTPNSFIALQAYRVAPLGNGYSSAELLMGRKLRTSLPYVLFYFETESCERQ